MHLEDPHIRPSDITLEQERLFALPEGQDYAIQHFFEPEQQWRYFSWVIYQSKEEAVQDAIHYRSRYNMRVVRVCRYLAGSDKPLVHSIVRYFDLRE